MRTIARAYGRMVIGLAVLGAASLAFATVAIIIDVMLRNLGFRPLQWSSAVVEYIMLFVTMAGGPWLVRTHGHVAVNSLVSLLPDRARRAVGILVCSLCSVMLFFLAWRAALLGLDAQATGTMDIRSVVIPGYLSYAMLGVGFLLMALEFLRLLIRGETSAPGAEMHA